MTRGLFSERVVLQSGRMAKGLQVLRIIKASKCAITFIAVDARGNALVQHPIDQGKDGQAESIRPWNQNDAYKQNRAAQSAIKIFD